MAILGRTDYYVPGGVRGQGSLAYAGAAGVDCADCEACHGNVSHEYTLNALLLAMPPPVTENTGEQYKLSNFAKNTGNAL